MGKFDIKLGEALVYYSILQAVVLITLLNSEAEILPFNNCSSALRPIDFEIMCDNIQQT